MGKKLQRFYGNLTDQFCVWKNGLNQPKTVIPYSNYKLDLRNTDIFWQFFFKYWEK